MLLREHIAALRPEKLQKVMKKLSKFGDPNEILQSIRQTPPCCQSDAVEVILTERFVIVWYKRSLFQKTDLRLTPVDGLVCCMHCLKTNGVMSEQKLFLADGRSFWLNSLRRNEAYTVYKELNKRCVPFEKLPEHPLFAAVKDNPIHGKNQKNTFHFQGLSLVERGTSWGKPTEVVRVSNIRDVLWAIQLKYDGGEDSDDFFLTLVLADGKNVDLECGSCEDCFRLAIELKRRIPHMIYGPDNEYTKILKRDRRELEAVLKGEPVAKPETAAATGFHPAVSVVDETPAIEKQPMGAVQIPGVYQDRQPRFSLDRVRIQMQRVRTGSVVEVFREARGYRVCVTWISEIGQRASRAGLLSAAEAVWLEEQVYRTLRDPDNSLWQGAAAGDNMLVEIMDSGRCVVSIDRGAPCRKYYALQNQISRLVQYGSAFTHT